MWSLLYSTLLGLASEMCMEQ